MTPKEKASDLYEKFRYKNTVWVDDENYYSSPKKTKECAIIAIEIEYHSLREQLFNLKSCGVIENEKVYLKIIQDLIDEEKEVKQEIEKL